MNLKGVVLHDEAMVAKNVTILGEATIDKGVNIWPGVVIRADDDTITIGENTNIQDNAVLHVYHDYPLSVGKNVTIGHCANVHSCIIEDNCIIGMNSVVMDGAVVGKNSVIGAGAVIGKEKVIPPNSIVVGMPGKVIKTQDEEGVAFNLESANEYVKLAKRYVEEGIFVMGKDARGVVPGIAFKEE